MYASSVQGIPANRPRLDVQARMFCFNHKAHTAPQPIEVLSLQPARLDAREHSSHHSPRLAITAKIASCLLFCPAILSCLNTCPARLADPSKPEKSLLKLSVPGSPRIAYLLRPPHLSMHVDAASRCPPGASTLVALCRSSQSWPAYSCSSLQLHSI